jgi:hypothetical protein
VNARSGIREIESDIEQTRRRLDSSLGALQQKLSPNEIFDQGLSYLRDSGGPEFARNLGRTVRDNPLPVVLVGAGLAWLMVADQRRRREPNHGYEAYAAAEDGELHPELRSEGEAAMLSSYDDSRAGGSWRHRSRRAYEDVATKADEAAASLRQRADETSEAFQERLAEARAGILGIKRKAEETAAEFAAAVERAMAEARERYRDMQASATHYASSARRRAADMGSRAYAGGRSAAYGAGSALGEVGTVIRENPMPVALMGAGLAWLIMSQRSRRRSPYEDDWMYAPSEYDESYGASELYGAEGAYDDVAARAEEAAAGVSRGADETSEAYSERVAEARAKVLGLKRGAEEALDSFRARIDRGMAEARDRYHRLQRSAARFGASARHRAGALGSRAYASGRSAAHGVSSSVGEAASFARQSGQRTLAYVEDQPLLMGLIGLSVGAVLGMLFPPTRYEREYLGGMRERLGEDLRERATHAVEGAGRVVSEMARAGREAATREGLTPEQATAAARDAARTARERAEGMAKGVRHVVEETAAAGREAAEREAGMKRPGEEPGRAGSPAV